MSISNEIKKPGHVRELGVSARKQKRRPSAAKKGRKRERELGNRSLIIRLLAVITSS